jgi:hypothetical protein
VRASLSLLLLAAGLPAEWRLAGTASVSQPIRGAAVAADGSFYTWGRELRHWEGMRSVRLAGFETREGGCLMDRDVVAPTAQGLAVFRAPEYRRHIIDAGAVVWDCLAAEILGHRGILVVHRGMQVRFYEPGPDRWTYREIYSFYTPSEQAGLRLRDIDGDGHPDIICGNYWIQSPARFELPWRLFAINTLNDKPRAASARLVFWGERLVWAESRESPARLVVLTPQPDPKLIWKVETISNALRYPQALAMDGPEILVAENAGPISRLLAGGVEVASGWPAILLYLSGRSLFQIGAHGVRRFDRAPDSSDTKGVVR